MVDISLLGLSEQKSKETLKNAPLTKTLLDILTIVKESNGASDINLSKSQQNLLYQLGTKVKAQCKDFIPLIVKHILNDGIKSEAQVTAALNYILKSSISGVKEDDFKKASGIGVVVTVDEIEDAVTTVMNKYMDRLKEERYAFNAGILLGELRTLLPWADGAYVKKEVDLRILEHCGPKTTEELQGMKKRKMMKEEAPTPKGSDQKKESTKPKDEDPKEDGAATIEELMRTRASFHKVGENFTTNGYVTTVNTKDLLRKHVEATGGKVVTRFPPEPNGVLHIGHAKAININFGYAKAHDGVCYLRFDDTNPEKEEEKFFLAIEDMVKWLGYTPYKITHSSDYFQQLYEWAVILIKKNHAFVCHQKVEDMRGFEVQMSPWRDRSVAESLQLFEDMKNGKFDEGEATLRLKLTLEEGKVDPVAYRIKYVPHHRTGSQWCIYPTYDYTHCLCDSIENITHSLCTKEFQSRRSSYYWLCNALDIYCPVQWEYGRLNVNYTVVSKRKILKLITTKTVSDWDDPRLFTLTALRRRGIPAEAINSFVAKMGLTMSQMVIDPHVLDASVREYLNANAPRTMVVLDGLKITIRNFAEANLPSRISVPTFPGSESSNSDAHDVGFSSTIYIEKTDYRQTAEKGFRRLSKTQTVGLKHVGIVLRAVEEVIDAVGNVIEVVVEAQSLSEDNKPKAFIHWVAKPVMAEVRLYERLFNHKNPEDPAQVPNGFLSDINENSMTVLHNTMIDESIRNSKIYDRFQFERIGYFSVDPDSTVEKLVFNRTVLLKEDSGKN